MSTITTIIVALSLFFTAFLADSCDDNPSSGCPAGQHWVQREGYSVCE